MGGLTDPRSLRPSLGREGWCQRLLTELILDRPYPSYNSRLRPSPRGLVFLGALDRLCFGEDGVSTSEVEFVDEIDFPARHPDERGCAPDYTVFALDRCWMIELKTELGSHDPGQIPRYFDRAHHYHPDLRIDITYLTAGLRAPFEPPLAAWERFAHAEWSQVAELVQTTWSDASEDSILDVMDFLLLGIAHLDESAPAWWARLGYDVEPAAAPEHTPIPSFPELAQSGTLAPETVQEGLRLAEETARDGKQRAMGLESGGLDALDKLRLELRCACRSMPPGAALRRIQPWLWNAATSGGTAMTSEGRRLGYEVRISRGGSGA